VRTALEQQHLKTANRATGNTDANQAIAAAKKVVTRAHDTWIYADIEPATAVTANWLLGWWDVMGLPIGSKFGGVGGLYANTWAHSNFSVSYISALKTWEKEHAGEGLTIVDKINLWAQTPSNTAKYGPNTDPDTLTFTPTAPDAPAGHSQEVAIWQYATNCFPVPPVARVIHKHKQPQWAFDMEVATHRGFDSMWQPHVL
jgi:hypothetical protein